jgi:hypothetical protein
LRRIQKITGMCVPKIFVEGDAKAVKSHIDDRDGGVVPVATLSGIREGQLVRVPPELIQQVEFWDRKAYEISGVSALAAANQKPAGLDSGRAVREFNDIQSERFVIKGFDYERFHIESAKICVALARREGDLKVGREKLKWSELSLSEDDYTISTFAVSAFSKDPSRRLQEVQDYVNAGVISPETSVKLYSFPDLEDEGSMIRASADAIEYIAEKIISEGVYIAPEAFHNLQYGISHFRDHLNKAVEWEYPSETVDMLLTWVEQANQLMAPEPVNPGPPQGPSEVIGAPGEPPMAPQGGVSVNF